MKKKHLKPIIMNKSKQEINFQKLNDNKIKRELGWKQKVSLKSELFSNDGNKKFAFQSSGHFKEAQEIGYKVGKELLKKAGSDFITQGN